MIKLIIAFTVGTVFGMMIMSCCAIAKREDELMEKLNEKRNKDEADIS